MSYQPPPPPSPGPGRPAAGFDPKSVNPLDWGVIAVGFLLLIPFSFFGYISADTPFGSDSVGAWDFTTGSQFITWLAMILGVLGGAAVAVALFLPQVNLPVPARLAGLGLMTVSLLLYVLAIFVHPEFGSAGEYSVGHGFSFWLSLILAAAGTAMSLMRFQATGGQLPANLQGRVPNVGGYGPQGGLTGSHPAPPAPGGTPPPPPPGYGQPQ